jgi:hypothetical protein
MAHGKKQRCTVGRLTGFHITEGPHPGAFAVPKICRLQAAGEKPSTVCRAKDLPAESEEGRPIHPAGVKRNRKSTGLLSER